MNKASKQAGSTDDKVKKGPSDLVTGIITFIIFLIFMTIWMTFVTLD